MHIIVIIIFSDKSCSLKMAFGMHWIRCCIITNAWWLERQRDNHKININHNWCVRNMKIIISVTVTQRLHVARLSAQGSQFAVIIWQQKRNERRKQLKVTLRESLAYKVFAEHWHTHTQRRRSDSTHRLHILLLATWCWWQCIVSHAMHETRFVRMRWCRYLLQ